MTSINMQDYSDPKLNPSHLAQAKMDSVTLRQSHFSLGDRSQAPHNQYETTYGSTHNPKQPIVDKTKGNMTFKSSLIINGDGPTSYQTENRSK
jgi:hypothetical protein